MESSQSEILSENIICQNIENELQSPDVNIYFVLILFLAATLSIILLDMKYKLNKYLLAILFCINNLFFVFVMNNIKSGEYIFCYFLFDFLLTIVRFY